LRQENGLAAKNAKRNAKDAKAHSLTELSMKLMYSIGSANKKMAGKSFPAKSVEEENQIEPKN
jgi:hypothetical protein